MPERIIFIYRALQRIGNLHRRGKLHEGIWLAIRYIGQGNIVGLIKKLTSKVMNAEERYRIWQNYNAVTDSRRADLQFEMRSWANPPLISVIMPTYKPKAEFLKQAVESVINQTYRHWELCIVDDGSQDGALRAMIEGYAGADSRIKIQFLERNRGISAASNAALEMATGSYIALLDHDDELALHALHMIAKHIRKHPLHDWIYSDEDKISPAGHRYGPIFKPDWSPEFMLGCMYTCHLGVYRASMVRELGGFRSEYDTAQDYDLALRFASITQNIGHVPDVLYHWRSHEHSTASGANAKPEAEMIARKALQQYLERTKTGGTALAGPIPGTHRPQIHIAGQPLVSIVIPSAGYRTHKNRKRWYIADLLESLFAKTAYKNFEIILVDNDDFEPALTQTLSKYPVRYVHYKSPEFNIADKLNLGVEQANGKFLILLNDDMTIITPEWIEEMLMYCQQDGIAAVGAKLLFPNNTIQHAGVVMLSQGPSHVYYQAKQDEAGLVGSAVLARNYLAVTGACLMVRKSDYIEVGGFDPAFRVNYNDIDFCLKLFTTKGRIVYTPYAQLYHYESASKDHSSHEELLAFNEKWKAFAGNDPYYNPNFSQTVINLPDVKP